MEVKKTHIGCHRKKERKSTPTKSTKLAACFTTIHCVKFHHLTQHAKASVQKWQMKIITNQGVVEKISALIMNFLLSLLLLWNSRHFILFLHTLVSQIPFYVSIKITMKRKIILLWKFMRIGSLEARLFIPGSIMTFKNTVIVCLCGYFVLVLFLCGPCQFPYLCSCRTWVLGTKVANH